MNDQSICARWRADVWDCNVLDSLIDPSYFNPPLGPPPGRPILQVTSFHIKYPEGHAFERTALGDHWTRTS